MTTIDMNKEEYKKIEINENSFERAEIYIHIPFCIKKCAYCDFYSQSDYSLAENYISALIKEMKLFEKDNRGRVYDSVYIGGGTPTSLSTAQLKRLVLSVFSIFDIDESAEITIEANPATFDEEKIKELSKLGVNRISIGLQSTLDCELKMLSRIHSYDEFYSSYMLAKKYFSNISVDIMFALPKQTLNGLVDTLKQVISLNPSHISFYALKIEEGTPFWELKDSLSLPDENETADMYLYACEYFEKNGYFQYEISNFARQGSFSRHNLGYWKRKEYIGFGSSAHSFWKGKRFSHRRDIVSYINSLTSGALPKYEACTELTSDDDVNEQIMLSLRLTEGLDIEYLKEKTGYDIYTTYRKLLDNYISDGYMKLEKNKLSFTPKGFLVSNYIISELMI